MHIRRLDIRAMRRFFQSNTRLLLLLACMLAGVVLGCVLFVAYGRNEHTFLSGILGLSPLEKNMMSALTLLYSACFQSFFLLLILFVSGLSACGLPFMLAVPLFFGLGIGMSEAYYYSTGWHGILLTVVLIIPPLLLKGAAVLMAASEGMRMTVLIGKRLLGADVEIDGAFRLYMLRFVVFALVALAGGIVEVLLRMFCDMFL